MSDLSTTIDETQLAAEEAIVSGQYTTLEGEDFFVIKNYDQMRPFFMTIVSASNHWMFISSNGALSAGRRNPDNAIFPYYTDDKITDSVGTTGAACLLRVKSSQGTSYWEPFVHYYHSIYKITANLYKNREGNKIVFEEVNHDLGLTYRYGWMFSEAYGIVKKCYLFNDGKEELTVEYVDGVQNIIPSGVDSQLQNIRSTLVDAYKRSELDQESDLAIYSLSSMIVDRAEPSEALKSSTAWSVGLDYSDVLLSSLQLKRFRKGLSIEQELDIKAEKGAFFIHGSMNIKANTHQTWAVVCELSQTASSIIELKKALKNRDQLFVQLNADVLKNKQDLRKKIGLTDGIQLSNDRPSTGRHFSNVLFNIMRGGTFDDQYQIETADFISHIQTMNRPAANRLKTVLAALPDYISYHRLRHFLLAAKHKNVMRYYFEYLPLSFSRRHGDPSRPWNHFSIETKDEEGKKVRNFEGNWRDIFQNWEALAFSYPEFTLGMIAKFVNASTIDGYNPYRIMREGIDWEVIDPNDPWAHIGYWGDHQIIYLCKFLEISFAYHPHRLIDMLSNHIFTYANVPYRIKGYDAIASSPKHTIDFDEALENQIKERVKELGSDGKLVWNNEGHLERVNLTEKLLVTLLTKLYNFIPEGGIWLNTQRPEWNDANNALVGNGVSMVTLYYLRRFINFLQEMFAEIEATDLKINKPVVDLMEALSRGFRLHQPALKRSFSDEERRQFMDDFGIAGEHYRTTAYAGFTGEKRNLNVHKLLDFLALAQSFLEHSIDCNQREDDLYHAYNLVLLSEGQASISPLYEMLEGQVAILSAKYLKPKAVLAVLNALKSSEMFRPDQYSYMLYPDRDLPTFLKKNVIPSEALMHSELVTHLLSKDDRSIIERDINGGLHFNGDFHHAKDLEEALHRLEDAGLKKLVKKDKKLLLDVFEEVFDHRSFTGRSGSFYGYEGLGSIYWHMVSKLLLAIQENIYWLDPKKESKVTIGHLIEHYFEIRAGIGVNKSPELYGAFPTDAYSHTPKYAGAKQPGMTGQVKEDIINRWAELGIVVKGGCLSFQPRIFRKSEFIEEAATLSYYDHNGDACKIDVPAGAMAFTYCQIPIVYRAKEKSALHIYFADGTFKTLHNKTVDATDSKEIFKRSGKITSIEVWLTDDELI